MFLPLLAFVSGTLLIITAGAMLMPRRATAIERRLEELTVGGAPEEEKPGLESLVALFKRVGEKAPRSPKERSCAASRCRRATGATSARRSSSASA